MPLSSIVVVDTSVSGEIGPTTICSVQGALMVGNLSAIAFTQIYDLGIAGVDLDQNLGAGIPHCYDDKHDHPPGTGWWKYQSMYKFLEGVRTQAREKHADSFIGVEEPCEAFIPVIDIVHGRAFTDTVWPAAGPGAVSVPLYLYLYHQYQLHYAGWIDSGFSPWGDVRSGIGRATIFGMQPGVRIGKAPFQLHDDEPSTELMMLRDAAQITHRCRDYLLLGRMLHDPDIKGSPPANNTSSTIDQLYRSPGQWFRLRPGDRRPATSAMLSSICRKRNGPSSC